MIGKLMQEKPRTVGFVIPLQRYQKAVEILELTAGP